MRAEKAPKKVRSRAAADAAVDDGMDALRLVGTALARHETAIAQLAEVVVNLHANVRALRDVVEALAEGEKKRAVVAAKRRLARTKLDE